MSVADGADTISPTTTPPDPSPGTAASVRSPGADRTPSASANSRWFVLLAGILLLWIIFVAGFGIVLALQAHGFRVAGAAERSFATPEMTWAAAIVTISCLAAALLTRWLRPAATLPVTFAVGAAVLVIAAIATTTLSSLLVTLVLFAVAWLVGYVALGRLSPIPDAAVVRAPLSIALGLGINGLILFVLGALGHLDAPAVLIAEAVVVLALLFSDRQRLREDAQALVRWRPETPTWLETVVTGVVVGVVAFALLAVFVPENTSDAILLHLPIAREIWQTGSLAPSPLVVISREPIAGHLLFAVAYGFGGLTAAKMIHAGVGLVAIAGIAGIAWLSAGRRAATAAAAIFACMPLVLWLLGHAFVDLYPVLFTVATVLCLLIWQRDGRNGWLVCAGILASSGAAAKLPTMALMIVAIALALLLVGREPGHWGARIVAIAVFGLSAAVVVAPWLVRSLLIAGGLSRFRSMLGDAADDSTGARVFGQSIPDHSVLSLIKLPWELTFNAAHLGFPIFGRGEIGFAGLMLVPLLLFAPRTRMTAFLTVTAGVGLFGWWLTPLQVTRHALPALAIAAALAGIGFVGAITVPSPDAPRRTLALAAQTGLVVSCIAAVIYFLPARLATLPVELFTGQQSAAGYIAQQLPVVPVLAAASDAVPPGSLVAYIGRHTLAPQIYTDAQLAVYEYPAALGETPDEVLTKLDELGIQLIVWNRYTAPPLSPDIWRAAVLSTEFLRDHTRIIAGDDDVYVFALLAGESKTWGMNKPRNLLADPDLDTVASKGPWTTEGTVRARKGVVTMRDESSLAQQAPVTAGAPYLLTATASCATPDDRASLSLRWLGSAGQELGADTEDVYPGVSGSEQFIWRRAPQEATAVSAAVASQNCKLDKVSLYQLD